MLSYHYIIILLYYYIIILLYYYIIILLYYYIISAGPSLRGTTAADIGNQLLMTSHSFQYFNCFLAVGSSFQDFLCILLPMHFCVHS